MKKFLALTMVALMCLSLGAKERTQRYLLKNSTTFEQMKASLVMDRKWVPYPDYSDRAGWNKFLGEYKDEIIRNGEKYLDYQWKVVNAMDYVEFERSGNRAIMETPHNANENAIANLFAAEMAEGSGRFVPQIINGVFHMCELTSWSISAHLASLSYSRRSLPEKGDNTLELNQGGLAQMFSWIYYFLKDEFDKVQPEFSRRLRQELQYRELDAYLTRDDFWWMGKGNSEGVLNNWTPWCTANALICFSLLEDDRETLAKAVWKGMESVDEYLNYVQGDGGIEEGPSYWGHAAGKLYDYLNALSMITGGKVTIFDQKQVKDMGEYIAKSYVGDDWVVNFADASARGGGQGDLIYRYGKAVGSDLMTGYAVMLQGKHPFKPGISVDFSRFMESIRYADEFLSAEDVYTPTVYTWYPETEFEYISNDKGVFLAARGGYNNESHNHNDVGSFILYYDNLPVIIDVGVGTYTRQTFSSERYTIWTMQSNYHNVPMINGVPQSFGSEYRSSDVVATKDGLSLNIAKAYPEDAGVQQWIRSYKLSGATLRIDDRFTLKDATAPNVVNFMTWGDVDLTTPGVITVKVRERTMQLKYDKNLFDVEKETVKVDDKNISRVWGSEVYRISLKASKLQKSSRYSFTLSKI